MVLPIRVNCLALGNVTLLSLRSTLTFDWKFDDLALAFPGVTILVRCSSRSHLLYSIIVSNISRMVFAPCIAHMNTQAFGLAHHARGGNFNGDLHTACK